MRSGERNVCTFGKIRIKEIWNEPVKRVWNFAHELFLYLTDHVKEPLLHRTQSPHPIGNSTKKNFGRHKIIILAEDSHKVNLYWRVALPCSGEFLVHCMNDCIAWVSICLVCRGPISIHFGHSVPIISENLRHYPEFHMLQIDRLTSDVFYTEGMLQSLNTDNFQYDNEHWPEKVACGNPGRREANPHKRNDSIGLREIRPKTPVNRKCAKSLHRDSTNNTIWQPTIERNMPFDFFSILNVYACLFLYTYKQIAKNEK